MGQISPVFGSIIPSQSQLLLANNYLAFNAGANDFAQQYLPEVYEAEVERYGNRTLNGFLRMVGAEMPMSSDQVIWSEQNRLHIAYTAVQNPTAAAGGGTTFTFVTGGCSVKDIKKSVLCLFLLTWKFVSVLNCHGTNFRTILEEG